MLEFMEGWASDHEVDVGGSIPQEKLDSWVIVQQTIGEMFNVRSIDLSDKLEIIHEDVQTLPEKT